MADKNLTPAILALQDKRRKRERKAISQKRKAADAIVYRPRSFDTFYFFSTALLIMALGVQVLTFLAYL